MSLYNDVRPTKLSEVRGQEQVVSLLKDNISKGVLPNAMLFNGTRGTGKTTVARIIARTLNCENPNEDGEACCMCAACQSSLRGENMDIIEMDAASNNGVDNIRALIEQISYQPLGKKKVVILDEVHMLSMGAFNALLKVLEEPPAHVVFILCTTELQKIPATILSRCRKYQFVSISEEQIVGKLGYINGLYGKDADKDALFLVAKAAKGSMRDAESIYEPFLLMDGKLTADIARKGLGYSSEENIFLLFKAISVGNPMIASVAIDGIVDRGESLVVYLEDCYKTLLDIIRVRMGDSLDSYSESYQEQVGIYAHAFSAQRLFEISNAFCDAYEKRHSSMSLVMLTMVTGLCCTQSTITELEKRVQYLESVISNFVDGERPVYDEKPVGDEKPVIVDIPFDVDFDFSEITPGAIKVNSSEKDAPVAADVPAVKEAEEDGDIAKAEEAAYQAAMNAEWVSVDDDPFADDEDDDEPVKKEVLPAEGVKDTSLGAAKVAALAALGFSYKPSPSAVPADSDDDSGDGADDSDCGEAGDKTKEDVVTDFSDLFESFDFARL